MKKGFTLVELLAVIVILAVILVIAVPQINSVIKQTKINSLGSTAKLIAAKAEEKEVENQALEQNQALSCSDLVKLDNNYGSCTVSIVNGKGRVTINGSGKFAGITCTGTKDNMSCTESDAPEYVYSVEQPYIQDVYTVTDSAACKQGMIQLYIDNGASQEQINSEGAQEEIEALCSNSSDIYNSTNCSGESCPPPLSTSEYFSLMIQDNLLTFSDISSFVEEVSSAIINATADYTTLKYTNTDVQARVFFRWPGNATNFQNVTPDICMLYRGNTNNDMNCFGTSWDDVVNVFGSDKCTESTVNKCRDNQYTCQLNSGEIQCGWGSSNETLDFMCSYIPIESSYSCPKYHR